MYFEIDNFKELKYLQNTKYAIMDTRDLIFRKIILKWDEG